MTEHEGRPETNPVADAALACYASAFGRAIIEVLSVHGALSTRELVRNLENGLRGIRVSHQALSPLLNNLQESQLIERKTHPGSVQLSEKGRKTFEAIGRFYREFPQF